MEQGKKNMTMAILKPFLVSVAAVMVGILAIRMYDKYAKKPTTLTTPTE